jgi:predicted DsbA family dithiol-disulfide isomerase
MSLTLLKRELEVATKDLRTTNPPVKNDETNKTEKKRKNHLGTERHGMKKRRHNMNVGNKSRGQQKGISFKFASKVSSTKADNTLESLEYLKRLDSQVKVNSSKILEHNFSKKRQTKVVAEAEQDTKTVFTEEDFERMAQEYFLHSKPQLPKEGD